MKTWIIPGIACCLLWACCSAPAFAQRNAYEIKAPEPVGDRSYVVTYLLVVVLAGLSVAAVCKGSPRHREE